MSLQINWMVNLTCNSIVANTFLRFDKNYKNNDISIIQYYQIQIHSALILLLLLYCYYFYYDHSVAAKKKKLYHQKSSNLPNSQIDTSIEQPLVENSEKSLSIKGSNQNQPQDKNNNKDDEALSSSPLIKQNAIYEQVAVTAYEQEMRQKQQQVTVYTIEYIKSSKKIQIKKIIQ
eukprot:TRINITY_DN14135_c0_g1_i1.p2 TRINITY_DN14135_c0_g1~~TRINITY_DN14135_c0_g1_i1.p2  ORF type:complete len:175 (+),score=24.54 TRINITY_DN14135_c0_g1_i1:182-706(+)